MMIGFILFTLRLAMVIASTDSIEGEIENNLGSLTNAKFSADVVEILASRTPAGINQFNTRIKIGNIINKKNYNHET